MTGIRWFNQLTCLYIFINKPHITFLHGMIYFGSYAFLVKANISLLILHHSCYFCYNYLIMQILSSTVENYTVSKLNT